MKFILTDELEEKYRTLYENALVGLWTSRIEGGSFIRANNTAARIAGYENAEDLMNNCDAIKLFDYETRIEFIRELREHGVKSGFEAIIIDKNNNIKEITISGKIDLEKGTIEGVFIDISELKKTQKAFRESEQKFRTITEQSLMGIVIFQKGYVKYINQAFAEIAGFSIEEMKNWPKNQFAKNIHPDDLPIIMQHIQAKEIDKTEDTARFSFRIITKSGKIKWIEIYSKSILYEGKFAILATVIDITDQISTEQQLKESEEKYRKIIENIQEGYFEVDLNGYFTFFNKALWKWTGFSSEELLGMKFDDFMTEENAKKTYKVFHEIFLTENPQASFQYEFINKDGKILYGVSSIYLKYDSNGNKIGFRGFLRDITEKKEVAEKLKDSEDKYRKIIENTMDGYFEVDLKGDFTFFNDALCKLLGYTLEELMGMNNREYMTTENAMRTFKVFNEVYNTGITQRNFQYNLIKKNGKHILGESSVYLRYDSNGKKIGFNGFLRDITEKKEAEERLKESEEKYRNLFDTSVDGIASSNENGDLIDANKAFLDMLGYSLEEAHKLNFREITPTKWQEAEITEVIKLFESGEGSFEFEKEYIRKDGTLLPVSVKYWLSKDESDEIKSVWAITRDFTERKKLDDKLKESEEKYRNIFEKSINAVVLLDFTGKIVECNSATERIFGYSKDELIGKNYLQLPFYDESMVNVLKERFQTITEEIDLKPEELEIIKKNGNKVRIKSNISYIKIGGQNFFQAMIRDITEQKIAEEKLKESEEKYRNMINDLDLGFYQVKWDGEILNVNPEFRRIMEYSQSEDLIGKNITDFWKNPEEQKKYTTELLKKNAVDNYIAIGQNRYGEELILITDSHLKKDENGKPIRVEGTLADITEKFKLEQKLKDSEERYRYLFENSPLAIILSDSNGIIRDTNPATESLIGYKKSEIIGRAFMNLSLVHEDHLPKIMERFKQQIMGNIQPPYDVQFYHKDGNLLWANIISTPIRIGEETFLQVIAHDVTKRKTADLLIKEEIKKLKELDQIRKDLISRVSHELKTPLIPVMGGAELLLLSYKDQLGKEPLEIIELIEKGGHRLAKLVERLLDITKIEYNKLKLEIKKIDLGEVISDAAKSMRYLAKKREIDLYLVVPEDFYLEIDGIRIEQVVTNLLSNAIKNTPPKGRISLMLEKYTSWAIISISDTGVGFTEEEMKKIFTRFGKIERYGEGLEYIDMGGSGLGLYISKQIIDLHGGKLWVESTGRNRGCIFKVRLPIK